MAATVMDGATIESDAMLAAGALLPPGRRVPSGELWAGTPARRVRELRPDELEAHAEQNRLYVELGLEYREVAAKLGVNVAGEYLQTQGELGFVVLEVDQADGAVLLDAIRAIPESIRTRVLW